MAACAAAGLSGYVPSSASAADLAIAAQQVGLGETVCSATMARGLFRHLREISLGRFATPSDAELTARQRQIVRLIGEGLSNKEIARRLNLGASTVKNHVHEILGRLQVTSRAAAAAHVRRNAPIL